VVEQDLCRRWVRAEYFLKRVLTSIFQGFANGFANLVLVMYLKALDRILWLTYGNNASSSKSREEAKVILETLSRRGEVARGEIMDQLGLDESTDEDVDLFNKRIRPLKGSRSGSPLLVGFLVSSTRDGDVYLRLSQDVFDVTWRSLKIRVCNFIGHWHGGEVPETETLDRMTWMAYANHSNTYEYRKKGRHVLKYLIETGKTEKSELMSATGYEYGDENDDQKFRGMMKYLRGSWKDEEDALNPLHTGNHGFLVSQEMKGQTAYYQVDVGEFKSTMNVVAGNIRSFLNRSG
jgi:hypothetical protein